MLKKLYLLTIAITFFTHASCANNPLVSIIVTVYNKEHQIDKVIKGIIDNTVTPFELVMIYDGCKDKSKEKVHEVLDANAGSMTKLIERSLPDVHETISNNTGMKLASGKYFILVQDDMEITERGWEQKLIRPMQLYDDVFAVSAEWAGSYHPFTTGTKKHAYINVARKNCNDFQIRDTVCRGPLALDAQVMKQLNYFDVSYAPCYMDDHDLCIRAYQKLKKVCGKYPIKYTKLAKTLHGSKAMSNGELFRTVIFRNRELFFKRYKSYFTFSRHDENRRIPEPETSH